jgi:DNA-binding FadR family transcriptional regulator
MDEILARAETGAAPPKGTVTQRAIDRIKAMIAQGLLEPGQKLPNWASPAARCARRSAR